MSHGNNLSIAAGNREFHHEMISRLDDWAAMRTLGAMKKTLVLVTLFLAAVSFGADAPAGKLAFEKDFAIWTAALDGSGAKKIAGGQAPELSPDGTRLAFNTVQAIGKPAHRQIAVADLGSGAITIFKDIPSDNCLQPVWAPDGSKLLFNFYKDNDMHIGLVNADGSGFRDLWKSEAKQPSYWAAAWAADGKSFFAEDMESLYRLDLEARVLKKWKIEELVPRGGMGGDVRLHASTDGRTLLMDVEMAEKERKGWDGPPPAIWTLDLESEKVTRVTPKTLYAFDGHWLDAGNIVFCSQAAGEDEPSIYRMSIAGQGKDRKLLVKKARNPSGVK